MLPNRERGRPTNSTNEMKLTGKNVEFNKANLTYGQSNVFSSVPGAEYLSMKETINTSLKRLRVTDEERLRAIEQGQNIVSDRILDDDDFKSLNKYLEKKNTEYTAKGGMKRKSSTEIEREVKRPHLSENEDSEMDEETEESGFDSELDEESKKKFVHPDVVTMSSITKLARRPKSNKKDRLETVEEGRKDRNKYGFKIDKMNPHASSTNREKGKKKVFGMVKHKIKRKGRRSFRDKQISLRDHLLKMAKQRR